jgi:hypothetical protein
MPIRLRQQHKNAHNRSVVSVARLSTAPKDALANKDSIDAIDSQNWWLNCCSNLMARLIPWSTADLLEVGGILVLTNAYSSYLISGCRIGLDTVQVFTQTLYTSISYSFALRITNRFPLSPRVGLELNENPLSLFPLLESYVRAALALFTLLVTLASDNIAAIVEFSHVSSSSRPPTKQSPRHSLPHRRSWPQRL